MPGNGMENRIIQEAYRILESPYDYLRSESRKGYRYFGFNCIYVPEEILHAAGFVPVRLFGSPEGIHASEKYIPGHCCEFTKGILSSFDRSVFDFLEGAAFGFCCDTMQVASNIVMERLHPNVLQVNVPTKLGSELTREYFLEETALFRSSIEERFNIRIEDEDLENSLKVYRENTRLLNRLKAFQVERPGSISGADRIALASAGFFMPRESHNELLEEVLQRLENEKPDGIDLRKKIIISGFIHNNIRMLKQIEDLGVTVIDDDLCEGSRVRVFW